MSISIKKYVDGVLKQSTSTSGMFSSRGWKPLSSFGISSKYGEAVFVKADYDIYYYIDGLLYEHRSGNATTVSKTVVSYDPSYTSSDGYIYAYYTNPSITLNLSYNANGGSGAPSPLSETTTSSSYTFTISSIKPTKTGYTFLGWSELPTATSASYSTGGSITVSSNTTLYAVWKINTYKLTYYNNGGSGAPSATTHNYNTTPTLSSTKPTRTGYTFLGWSTSSTATSATYSAGGQGPTMTANKNLYAVWKINTYKLTYNANSGSGAPSATTHNYNTVPTLSSTVPVRDGYKFLGWSTSQTATSATYNAGDKGPTMTEDTILYAVWGLLITFYWTNNKTVNVGSETPEKINKYINAARMNDFITLLNSKAGTNIDSITSTTKITLTLYNIIATALGVNNISNKKILAVDWNNLQTAFNNKQYI